MGLFVVHHTAVYLHIHIRTYIYTGVRKCMGPFEAHHTALYLHAHIRTYVHTYTGVRGIFS